ncbi:hypothetical protein WME91_34510 [Sorangium sp. So ce269]
MSKRLVCMFSVLGLIAGCSVSPADSLEESEPSAVEPSGPAEGEGLAFYASAELDRRIMDLSDRAAVKLIDPSYQEMADLGAQEDWHFFFDHQTQLLVATQGEVTLTFDSTTVTAEEIEAATGVRASPWGVACRAACWAAGGLGCAAVSVACTGVTVITIGGTTIPCSWAIIAACTAAGGGASICADTLCPP